MLLLEGAQLLHNVGLLEEVERLWLTSEVVTLRVACPVLLLLQ